MRGIVFGLRLRYFFFWSWEFVEVVEGVSRVFVEVSGVVVLWGRSVDFVFGWCVGYYWFREKCF